MGADPGIEPRLSDNETDVLPLDESAIWMRELALPQRSSDNETDELN